MRRGMADTSIAQNGTYRFGSWIRGRSARRGQVRYFNVRQVLEALGDTGFEPVTPSVSCWCASQLRQSPGIFDVIRTGGGEQTNRIYLAFGGAKDPWFCRNAIAEAALTPNPLGDTLDGIGRSETQKSAAFRAGVCPPSGGAIWAGGVALSTGARGRCAAFRCAAHAGD